MFGALIPVLMSCSVLTADDSPSVMMMESECTVFSGSCWLEL